MGRVSSSETCRAGITSPRPPKRPLEGGSRSTAPQAHPGTPRTRLAGAVLCAVAAVDYVAADVDSKVAADSARFGFQRVRGANQLARGLDNTLTLPHLQMWVHGSRPQGSGGVAPRLCGTQRQPCCLQADEAQACPRQERAKERTPRRGFGFFVALWTTNHMRQSKVQGVGAGQAGCRQAGATGQAGARTMATTGPLRM